MADKPVLFYEPLETIYNRMKTRYDEITEKTSQDAQPEMLIFRTLAYELLISKAQGDAAVATQLAPFSSGEMLDNLASNTGVTRQAATPAETTLQFTLVAGHAPLIIPANTKVRSTDGKIIFATDEEAAAGSGINTVSVGATALTDGPQGNSYPPGTITAIVDPVPFLSAATNLETTGAGADIETDEGLRRRIQISQNQFSTAGSVDSYKFWTLSANPSIIDAAIVNPVDEEGNSIGGFVNIYPLVAGGIATPQAVLDAVEDKVSAQTVRPMNDNVSVASPGKVTYVIPVELVLKFGAVQSTTEDAVIAAITTYCVNQSKKLGADITESQIKRAGMNDWVHSLRLPGFTDIIVGPTEFAVCSSINKIATSYEDIYA